MTDLEHYLKQIGVSCDFQFITRFNESDGESFDCYIIRLTHSIRTYQRKPLTIEFSYCTKASRNSPWPKRNCEAIRSKFESGMFDIMEHPENYVTLENFFTTGQLSTIYDIINDVGFADAIQETNEL